MTTPNDNNTQAAASLHALGSGTQGEWASLSEAYYKAANDLNKYRDRRKLTPGTRVRCQYRQDPSKMGVIAEYGDRWGTCLHTEVPVLLDTGQCQLWNMGDIAIAKVEGPVIIQPQFHKT